MFKTVCLSTKIKYLNNSTFQVANSKTTKGVDLSKVLSKMWCVFSSLQRTLRVVWQKINHKI